jgi:hypothetical protein
VDDVAERWDISDWLRSSLILFFLLLGQFV